MKNLNQGWIGVDFDGTLSNYEGWTAYGQLGAPIPLMLDRVKTWIATGERVKICTARATDSNQIPLIQAWLIQHGIGGLEITNQKDYLMKELWDDRAVQVIPNTGIRADGKP